MLRPWIVRTVNANCILAENGQLLTVKYQRSGMRMYSYKIFNRPLNDSLKKKYKEGYQYIFLTKKVQDDFC